MFRWLREVSSAKYYISRRHKLPLLVFHEIFVKMNVSNNSCRSKWDLNLVIYQMFTVFKKLIKLLILWRRWFFRLLSSGLWYHVALYADTDVSEEHAASVISIEVPTFMNHSTGSLCRLVSSWHDDLFRPSPDCDVQRDTCIYLTLVSPLGEV
jgi:hypothetical protein